MVEKVMIMKLKVNLQCRKCYLKVRKVLCKHPQIRDQWYDEKNGIVTSRVICCNPEKLRDTLCCQGGHSIQSIEIIDPKPRSGSQKQPEKDVPGGHSIQSIEIIEPKTPGPQDPPNGDGPGGRSIPCIEIIDPKPPHGSQEPLNGDGPGGSPCYYGSHIIYDSYYEWRVTYDLHPHDKCWSQEVALLCTITIILCFCFLYLMKKS